MHTQEAVQNIDFWTLDCDAFYVEDSLGWTKPLDVSGNHFDYFSEFPKIYRVAHSLFEEDNFLTNGWTKNKQHVLEIYNNLLIADLIWVSPVLVEILRRTMPQVLSKQQIQRIEKKFVVLPPPDYYKLDTISSTVVQPSRSFKKGLVFLWNHRLISLKNPKMFFEAIETFHKQHSKVPIEIRICASGTEKEARAFVPESLQKTVVYSPFISDPKEYSKFIETANITIGTSRIESFGISVFDCIRQGMTYINTTPNEAFSTIAGSLTTVNPKDVPDIIWKLYSDPKKRADWDKKNIQALNSLPNFDKAKTIFSNRVDEIVHGKIQSAKGDRSEKLKTALKVLSKKALSKQDLYRTFGWEPMTTCRNAFWGGYYFSLRKNGIDTKLISNKLYFYSDKAHLKSINETKIQAPKGLFK
jgi:glycosyltransferase involved in cell wall biosynthesis